MHAYRIARNSPQKNKILWSVAQNLARARTCRANVIDDKVLCERDSCHHKYEGYVIVADDLDLLKESLFFPILFPQLTI